MPQNAIIRADGSGGYTSIEAWEAAEGESDYGSVTVGRVDGFFDIGTARLTLAGTWPNGGRLEAFDSAQAFNGIQRRLCGLVCANNTALIDFRLATDFEIVGLELIYAGGSGTDRAISDSGAGLLTIKEGLVVTEKECRLWVNTPAFVNTVVVTHATSHLNSNGGAATFQGALILGANSSRLVDSNAASITDTVGINLGSGGVFATTTFNSAENKGHFGTTHNNVVPADIFVDSDPIGSKDYRLKTGGVLETNGIGYFFEASGTVGTVVDVFGSLSFQRDTALTAGISQQSQISNAMAVQRETATALSIEHSQFSLPVAAVQRDKAGIIDLTQQQTVASVVALQRDKAVTLDVGQQQVIASIVATQIERAGLVAIENAQAVTFIASVQRDVASQVNLEQTDAQLVTVVTATQRDRATTTLVSQIGVTELIAAIQRDTATVIDSSQSQTLTLVNAIQGETASQIAISVLGEQVDLSNHVLIPVTKAYRIEAHNIKTYSVTRNTKNYNIEVKH